MYVYIYICMYIHISWACFSIFSLLCDQNPSNSALNPHEVRMNLHEISSNPAICHTYPSKTHKIPSQISN